MVLPVAVVVVARELLALYLSGAGFTAIAAVTFAFVAWLLVDEWDIDRPNFLVAAVVSPFLFFGVVVGYAVPARGHVDVFQYLFDDGGIYGYPAAFLAAGFGAVGLSKQFRNLAERDERVPETRVVVAGVAGIVAVVAVMVLGANLAAASSVSVASVEPGVERPGLQDPTLNVTVAGGPAEVRVTAIAPDGTSVTRRLSRGDTRGGGGTVAVPVWFDDTLPPGWLPVQSGTYRVRVTALSGVPVDTATYEAEHGASLSVVETAAVSEGNVSWDDPPDRVLVGENRLAGEDHTTKVGVVVANRGAFHTRLSVALETPEGHEDLSARSLFPAPGERIGVVYGVPDDAVRAIRTEQNGVVTVKLYRDGLGSDSDTPVATATVELPEE